MSINASQPVLTGPVQNSALRDRDAFLGLVGVALVLFALSLPLALPGSGLSRTGFAVAVFAFALVLTRLSLPKDELVARRYISFGNAFLVFASITYGLSLFGPDLPAVARVAPGVVERTNLIGIPIAIAAFFVGYRMSDRKYGLGQLGSFVAPPSSKLAPPAFLGSVYLFTVLVRMFSLATGRLGFQRAVSTSGQVDSIGQIANDIGGFGNAIIALALLGYGTVRVKGYRYIPMVGIPIELAFGALSGRKGFFLLAGLSAVLMLVYIGRLRFRTLVLGGVAAFLFIFPVIDNFRDLLGSERSTESVEATQFVQLLGDATGTAVTQWFSSPGEMLGDTRDRSLERLRDVDRYALAVETHRTEPFESFETVPVNAAVRSVPRAVWPGKPVIRYGLDVSRTYYQLPTQVVTATSLSIAGDGYRYGGYPSLVVLMLFFGWVIRRWDIAFDHTKSVWLLAAFVPLFDIVKLAEHARVLPSAIRTTLILAVMMRLLLRRPATESKVGQASRKPA